MSGSPASLCSEATCRCSEAQFPLCAGVSLCQCVTRWHQLGREVGTHFPSEEKLGEVCREAAIIISNISASWCDTRGVSVSVTPVSRVTCLDYWICHVTRVTRPPLPWLPSLRWHWSLISQDHSYLNFAANYPAGVISSPSHNIQGYCLFTLGS